MTPEQLATLKTDVAGNTATIPTGYPWSGSFGGTQINAVPNNSDGNTAIAGWYNLDASPAYKVWNTAAKVLDLRTALDISKYTPTDSPPSSTADVQGTNDALLFNNRCLTCQLKQANAMFFVQGTGTLDATPQAIRQSFNDCMTAIPSGAGGATTNAGWGTAGSPGVVRLALQRNARNVEKLFSVQAAGAGSAGNVSGDPRGGTTNPDALVFIGTVSASDVETARNLP